MSQQDHALRSRPALSRELVGGLMVFACYLIVEALATPARRVRADQNGHLVMDLERRLHLAMGDGLNDWLAPHAVLSTIADYEYAFTYVISAFALLIWLYLRDPVAYRRARSSFAVLNLIGIATFALFPTTPPRLLPELGLVDTVTRGSTVGSWGMPLVTHANQLAAMPSLHVAWALWVSVVLARVARARGARMLGIQLLSAVHVGVTVLVVLATANHYLLDAIAAVPVVGASVLVVDWWARRSTEGRRTRLPATDAFFLHCETPQAPQVVGGLVLLQPAGPGVPSLAAMRAVVRDELGRLPRFTQRLEVRSRWRRAHWVDAEELDWSWHVAGRSVTGDGTEAGLIAALSGAVSDLVATPLPRDRPLWRVVMVHDTAAGRAAMVLLMHHCMADGVGTVLQGLRLMRPRIDLLAAPDAGEPSRTAGRALRSARTVVATAAGLAQLATDGRPGARLPSNGTPTRFVASWLPLATVRRVARAHGARVTDVLLCLMLDAVARTHPQQVRAAKGRLTVAVPLMVRQPGQAAETNLTAAVMVRLPWVDGTPSSQLAQIRRRTAPLHSPTRALASRFVMARALNRLPEPCLRRFARTTYGPAFLQAIVSNMPGPRPPLSTGLTLAEVEIADVAPIIPRAPATPLALGALSWGDSLGLGLAVDPDLFDAGAITAQMAAVLAELDGTATTDRPAGPAEPESASGSEPKADGDLKALTDVGPEVSAQMPSAPNPRARNSFARVRGESSSSPNSSRS